MVRTKLVPLEISTLVLFNLMVVVVAFPDFTAKLVVPAGKSTVCSAPADKVPCHEAVPLINTSTQAADLEAPTVIVLAVVGQFLTVTACAEFASAATATLNLSEALEELDFFAFLELDDDLSEEDFSDELDDLLEDFLTELAFFLLDTVTELAVSGIACLLDCDDLNVTTYATPMINTAITAITICGK